MLIILDRDGVINEDSADFIKSPVEWQAIPGSLEAIAQLNTAGHQVVIATNQSGVGRGYFSEETLAAIHKKMQHELTAFGGRIDGIFYCPHAPTAECECRKPKPGLFTQIGKQFHTDLHRALAVGDSMRDIEAAHAVMCPAVLVRTGKGEHTMAQYSAELTDVPIFADLAAVTAALLNDKL